MTAAAPSVGPGPAGGGAPAEPLRVTLVGLGAIGVELLRALLGRRSARLVAVADPVFAGRDAGEVAGVGPLGLPVAPGLAQALATPSDVALVLTTSAVADMLPLVELAAGAGLDVVSSCEDLAFGALSNPGDATQMDMVARAAGITVLGTGINPGFVMDRLPLALASTCVNVERIVVTRVVDAAKRRQPLQAKVGAGLTPEAFDAGVLAGKLGHRGLAESCALIAAGLGVALDDIRSTIGPVVSTVDHPRPGIAVGRVAGLRQRATGSRGGAELIRLDLEMSIGAPDPHDAVRIDGDPPIDLRIADGIHGDRGTIGAMLNALRVVADAPPGLMHVTDLPLFRVLV